MAETFAMVTGASSGIGLSLARELANRGYDLVICSQGERLDAAEQELRGKGVVITAVHADLATREGVDELWRTVTTRAARSILRASMRELGWAESSLTPTLMRN